MFLTVFTVKVLIRCLFAASTLVLTVQQMKEVSQEVRRLENLASLVACVKEHEDKGKEFKAGTVKVVANKGGHQILLCGFCP